MQSDEQVQFERYDSGRDDEDIFRMFREIGWLDPKEEEQKEQVTLFLRSGRGWVGRLNGAAECIAVDSAGTMRHMAADIPLAGITGVATSLVARKRGLATGAVARLLADEAAAGFALSALGVFDQGFYDRAGFGAGSYDQYIEFAPRQLQLPACRRSPVRLSKDDWQDMHACRRRRRRCHGSVTFEDPGVTRGEMLETKNGFGLGFRDEADGGLSHFIWCHPRHIERGPYDLNWIVWRTREQFLELLGLVKGLEEQVRLVSLCEPPEVQLHDLLDRPLAHKATAVKSRMDWQVRMCDVQACLAKTRLTCPALRFQLALADPVAERLPADATWRGVGGKYVVTLGDSCSAEPGEESGLPTLRASVNAFTRLWLGVRPASGLAITDDLAGPRELLPQLDNAFRLPVPRWDWHF